jgi:hypothetical protein
MDMDEPIWAPTVSTKNRGRLLNQEIARSFFRRVVDRAQDLMSDEHFTVDGTLVDAWQARRVFSGRTAARTVCCALPIAAAGLAGSVVLAVRRRGREIAVRMAFGASPDQVRRLVAGRMLTIAGASLAAGLVLGYLVAVAISQYLFGVTPADTLTAGATVPILMATAWSTTEMANLAHADARLDAVAARPLGFSGRRGKKTAGTAVTMV